MVAGTSNSEVFNMKIILESKLAIYSTGVVSHDICAQHTQLIFPPTKRLEIE